MGMVAANRIFKILDTESKIVDLGKDVFNSKDGSISLKMLIFLTMKKRWF